MTEPEQPRPVDEPDNTGLDHPQGDDEDQNTEDEEGEQTAYVGRSDLG